MIRSATIALLLATSGCAHLQEANATMHSSLLEDQWLDAPVAAHDVGVFVAGDDVPQSCVRVALLRAAPFASVVDRLREEAGRLGANSVDLRDFRNGGQPPEFAGENAWNATALHCPSG